MAAPTLEAIKYTRGSLQLLDQKQLPFAFEYVSIENAEQCVQAVREMKVRGAPAIAISAALALCVEASQRIKAEEAAERAGSPLSTEDAVVWLTDKLVLLKTGRPTAVNLFNECDRLAEFVREAANSEDVTSGVQVLAAYIAEAEIMLAKDISDNQAIGSYGADAIQRTDRKVKVLTHCNTGSLATARYGTALGVIRALHERDQLEQAYCTETRPYNQGSRLTAFELVFEKIPSTLVCDGAVSALMATKGVDAVVVGADRTVANGDTANKIGTYQLAIASKYHDVPFYIAVPFSSLDCSLQSGADIVIEERQPEELTCINGQRIAAEGIGVWNPQFDVAPAALITGLITEYGIITKRPGEETFDVPAFVAAHQQQIKKTKKQ